MAEAKLFRIAFGSKTETVKKIELAKAKMDSLYQAGIIDPRTLKDDQREGLSAGIISQYDGEKAFLKAIFETYATAVEKTFDIIFKMVEMKEEVEKAESSIDFTSDDVDKIKKGMAAMNPDSLRVYMQYRNLILQIAKPTPVKVD